MPKKEIVGGIRRAMNNGASLEEAQQSFINAGYNPDQVKKAAQGIRSLTDRVSQNQQEESKQNSEQNLPNLPEPANGKQGKEKVGSSEAAEKESGQPSKSPEKAKKVEPKNLPKSSKSGISSKSKMMIIILTVFLLLLIAGLIVTLLFKDQITSFLGDMFSSLILTIVSQDGL